MKKKSTIIAGLLLATVVTGYSVSGTYAKYVNAQTVTDEATVVAFTADAAMTFDLFADSIQPGSTGSTELVLGKSDEVAKYEYAVEVINDATYPTANTVVASDDYNPLRFALYKTDAAPADKANTNWLTFADLQTEINKLTAVEAGTSYTIEYIWFYDMETLTKATADGGYGFADNDAVEAAGIKSIDEKDTEIGTNATDKKVSLSLKVSKTAKTA